MCAGPARLLPACLPPCLVWYVLHSPSTVLPAPQREVLQHDWPRLRLGEADRRADSRHAASVALKCWEQQNREKRQPCIQGWWQRRRAWRAGACVGAFADTHIRTNMYTHTCAHAHMCARAHGTHTVTPRHATPRHATPRHVTSRHATPRHTRLCVCVCVCDTYCCGCGCSRADVLLRPMKWSPAEMREATQQRATRLLSCCAACTSPSLLVLV